MHLLENYQGKSATDAYGIAEPSNIATAPAIANAVYNAIGVRLRQLPMTPAAVLSRARPHAARELTMQHIRMDERAIGSRSGELGSDHGCRRHGRAGGGQARRRCRVVKAGGIDLLDLMKEGLLQPRRIVNLRGISGLDRIVEETDGGLRIGALVTLAQARRATRSFARAIAPWPMPPAIRRARRSAMSRRSAAICCSGRVAGISVRRATIASRKGGETCFAFAGENQYHAIFDHERLRHRASVDCGHGAGGVGRQVAL